MFKKLLAKARSSSVFGNLLMLVSGSALAQVIGVLAAPLLARLYTPEQFGVLGTVLAVAFVISVAGSLKYEMAFVLEKDDAKAHAIQRLCLSILLLITAISATGVLAMSLWYVYTDNQSDFAGYILWVIPIALFVSLFNIFNLRATREKAFKTISFSLVGRRLISVIAQIALGILGAQTLGLILGNLLGGVIAVAVIVVRERTLFTKKHDHVRLREVAKIHYRFAYYTAPQGFLNMLSNQLPIFMLGYFYGPEVVGGYFFAMRILQLPAAFIGQAIRQVFYREAADLVDNIKELRRLYLKTTGALAAIIFIPVLVLFIWGPPLFAFTFGENWRISGEYSRWMFLAVGLAFINTPSVMLYNVLNLQRVPFVVNVLLFLARFFSLLGGGIFALSAIETIAIYSLAGVFLDVILVLSVVFKLNILAK